MKLPEVANRKCVEAEYINPKPGIFPAFYLICEMALTKWRWDAINSLGIESWIAL